MNASESPVVPLRSTALETQQAGDDVLVHDTRHAVVHVLNTTAGEILSLCDGTRDVDAIVDAVAKRWSIAPARAREDVTVVLRDFQERGLLEGAAER